MIGLNIGGRELKEKEIEKMEREERYGKKEKDIFISRRKEVKVKEN